MISAETGDELWLLFLWRDNPGVTILSRQGAEFKTSKQGPNMTPVADTGNPR
jgi:hypothetical protein